MGIGYVPRFMIDTRTLMGIEVKGTMINGIHGVIYTRDAEGVRAFFKDKLGYPFVNAGHGWLIFALPPAELGIHPIDEGGHHELWLMCDDLKKTVAQLTAKGVEFNGPMTDEGFGYVTAIKMPGGGELGLFQPKHPTALHLKVGGMAQKARAKKKAPRRKATKKRAAIKKPSRRQ